MKFTWNTATGAITEDIPEEWYEILARMDMDDYNSWKRDHRDEDHGNCHRHNFSLDALDYEGEEYGAEDSTIKKMSDATDRELKLLEALSDLNEKQRNVIDALFYEEKSGKEYAEECGVNPAAITQQKNTAIKNLKKFFGQT